MTRSPSDLVRRLEALGATITLAGADLTIRPASRVQAELIEEIRKRKPDLVEYLARGRTDETDGTTADPPSDRPIRGDVAAWLMRQPAAVRRRWWRSTALRYGRCGNWQQAEDEATREHRGEVTR